MVQNLCINFSTALLSVSEPGAEEPDVFYPFPPPSALAQPTVSAKLRRLGFGYRAEYIQRTAEMLIEQHGSDDKIYSWLSSLRSRPTVEAREELLKLMGVGRKVADCILLMSMDKVHSLLRSILSAVTQSGNVVRGHTSGYARLPNCREVLRDAGQLWREGLNDGKAV